MSRIADEWKWMALKDLYNRHPEWYIKDYANALHERPSTIYQVFCRHNWEIDPRRHINNKFDKKLLEEMKMLIDNGLSRKAAAEYYGMTPTSVTYWMKKEGRKMNMTWTKEMTLTMLDKLIEGKNLTEAAHEMGLEAKHTIGRKQRLHKKYGDHGYNVLKWYVMHDETMK